MALTENEFDVIRAQYPVGTTEAALAMLDVEYYSKQADEKFDTPLDALGHYIVSGAKTYLRPHPLFDTEFYVRQNPEVLEAKLDPFLHYIAFGQMENRPFHPLYQPHSIAHQPLSRISLSAFLEGRLKNKHTLSETFNSDWYQTAFEHVAAEHELDIPDWSTTDPLAHYLCVGSHIGVTPCPAFDSAYYEKNNMSEKERRILSPLEHFDRCTSPKPKTFALFDGEYYKSAYVDIRHLDPVEHFVKHGVYEDRRFCPFTIDRAIYGKHPEGVFAKHPALGTYLSGPKRKRILLFGHEASRTGAPLILLRIVQELARHEEVECVTILDQGGALEFQFSDASFLYVAKNHRMSPSHRSGLRDEIRPLLALLSDNPPVAAICNTAETRFYAEIAEGEGIPVISLVHEIPTFYPEEELNRIIAAARAIVFPAEFVKLAFEAKMGETDTAHVISQGLLRDNYGQLPRGDRATTYKKLPTPPSDDATLVIGCGTLDGRKGFDLFVDVARQVAADPRGKGIRFIWLGAKRNWQFDAGAAWDTTGYWASWDLLNDPQVLVDVITEVDNTEPYLVNADIFLLTSRADPFPCVVHEAMASGLPVIGFLGGGGGPEAFLPDAGIAVPYRDCTAMAQAVLHLHVDQPDRAAMAEAGRRRIASHFFYPDYVAKLLDLAAQFEPALSLPALPREHVRRGRIFFATPSWDISGVNTVTEALVNHLNDVGFDAEVVLTAGRRGPWRPSGRPYDGVREFLPGCRYSVLQPESGDHASPKELLRAKLLEAAPCILVPGFDYAVSELARELPDHVGVLGVAHSDDAEHYSHAYRLGPFWNRIVAVSDEIGRSISSINPALSPKLHVIRNGLTPPEPADLQASIAEKRAGAAPIRMVYAGRFERFQKRIDDYAKLALKLNEERIDYELTLIGDGAERHRITAMLRGEIKAGRTAIPGRLPHAEAVALMEQAHVVLILSDFEGLPMCLIEGLQRGCIPIVYDMRSGIPEIVRDGVNGFIVPNGDIGQVVARLRSLRDDDAMRSRMIDNALLTSGQLNLTSQSMGEAYAKLFDDIFADMRQHASSRALMKKMLNA